MRKTIVSTIIFLILMIPSFCFGEELRNPPALPTTIMGEILDSDWQFPCWQIHIFSMISSLPTEEGTNFIFADARYIATDGKRGVIITTMNQIFADLLWHSSHYNLWVQIYWFDNQTPGRINIILR